MGTVPAPVLAPLMRHKLWPSTAIGIRQPIDAMVRQCCRYGCPLGSGADFAIPGLEELKSSAIEKVLTPIVVV
jgi:hypothetical protein